METKSKRPVFVSVAVAFLWLSLLLNLFGMYRLAGYLVGSGWENLLYFTLGVILAILIIVTVMRIQNRLPYARVLGLITFGTFVIVAFNTFWTLLNWNGGGSKYMVFAWLIVALRLGFSAVLFAAFAFSSEIKNYFTTLEPFTPPHHRQLSLTSYAYLNSYFSFAGPRFRHNRPLSEPARSRRRSAF